jgi:hypothetical protein
MTKDEAFKFQTSNNTLNGWVMKITADRRLEVNEDVDVTEAAKQVLEAMQWMLDKQKRTWVGLTEEEIALIDWESLVTRKDCVRAIEAKLRSKNYD